MLEIKEITIDGMKFQLHPLKGLKAVKLDKKVISLLLPLVEGVSDMDSQIDIGKALNGLSGAISNLEDQEYENFVCDLLSTTIIMLDKKPPEQIESSTIDEAFQGHILTLYKLMMEVMKYNKFTPFVLAGGGGFTMSTIAGSLGLNKVLKS